MLRVLFKTTVLDSFNTDGRKRVLEDACLQSFQILGLCSFEKAAQALGWDADGLVEGSAAHVEVQAQLLEQLPHGGVRVLPSPIVLHSRPAGGQNLRPEPSQTT